MLIQIGEFIPPPATQIFSAELVAQRTAEVILVPRVIVGFTKFTPPKSGITTEQGGSIRESSTLWNDNDVQVLATLEQPYVHILRLPTIKVLRSLHLYSDAYALHLYLWASLARN